MYFIYKYRIYPDDYTKRYIAKQSGTNRFIWNHFVALEKTMGRYMSYGEMAGYVVTHLKQEYDWIKEVSAQSIQQTLRDFDKAVKMFFKNKAFGKPAFKKKSWAQSFRIAQYTAIDRAKGLLTIPKLQSHPIKIILHRELPEYSMVTILKESDDKYFACFFVQQESAKPLPITKSDFVGIDLGLKDFIIVSDGERASAPKFFRQAEENISRKNRALSTKKKGSRRWLRARKRLSVAHAKARRKRHDWLHQLSTRLTKKHKAIAVETLAIQNMTKKRNLAKSILDASWGRFCLMLEYKLPLKGGKFVSCGGSFASTQICSTCKNQTGPKGVENLHVRSWTCQSCGNNHDRDLNAAMNIAHYGSSLKFA